MNKEGLRATRQENGQNNQPYYEVGDFNRDGQEGFAVALINQGKRYFFQRRWRDLKTCEILRGHV